MATPKGSVPNPNGRPKGIPNKATMMAREAIADFVDGNADRLTGWLDQIAVDNPKAAFECFMSVVEYHIPKLQRTELKGGIEITQIMPQDKQVMEHLKKKIRMEMEKEEKDNK